MGGVAGPEETAGLFNVTESDTTDNPAGLIRGSEVPDDVPRNDDTTTIVGGGDVESTDVGQLEKELRDLGVTDPTGVQFRTVPAPELSVSEGQGAPMRVVAEDQEGNRVATIATGPRGRAESILQSARRAQQKISGAANQKQSQDPAAEDPPAGVNMEEAGPPGAFDLLGFIRQGLEAAANPIQGAEGRANLRDVGEARNQIPAQSGGGTTDETEGTAQAEPQQSQSPQQETQRQQQAQQQAQQQQTQQNQGDPLPTVDEMRQLIEGTALEEGAPREGRGSSSAGSAALQDAVARSGGDQTQQDQTATQEGGGALQNFGEIMQKPEVQKGLAQLAQLFVSPDSGTARVARQLVKNAEQEQKAQQIQQLVSGEGSPDEIESPSVLTTADKLKTSGLRRDVLQSRIEKRRLENQLTLKKLLSNSSENLPDVDSGAIQDAMGIVAGEWAAKIRQQAIEGVGAQEANNINAVMRLGKNVDPITVLSNLPEKHRDKFLNDVATRIAEGTNMTEGQARSLIGGWQGQVGGGQQQQQQQQQQAGSQEENDAGVTGLNQDEVDILRNGGTVTFDQPRNINGKEFPPGTYTYRDGAIQPPKK